MLGNNSNIVILWSVNNHHLPIHGIAGVTDVNSASFNTIFLLKNAEQLFIVKDNNAVKLVLKKYSNAVLVGESTEPGLQFYASNSPAELYKMKWKGLLVIQKTNNGTIAVAETFERGADLVFGFHWSNLETVALWLRKNFEQRTKNEGLTLVASGGRENTFKHVKGQLLEDWYCAEALKNLLENKKVDYEKYFVLSRKSIKEQYPPGDPSDATQVLILQANTLSGIIPVFTKVEAGIYKVENALK